MLGLGDDGLVSGFYAKTETPGLNGDDTAFQLSAAADTEEWSYSASVMQVGENFNPEVGFLRRTDFKRVGLFAFYMAYIGKRPKSHIFAIMSP